MARSLRTSVLQRSDRTVMILAAVFAAIAAILVFIVLSSAGDDSKPSTSISGETTSVVTASQAIPAGTRITSDMLAVTSIPTGLALAGGYTAAEGLVGLTTRTDVVVGEQIIASKIGEAQSTTDDKSLARVVPAGLRAIAIPVDEETSVGGLILPGDIVDVIAVFSASDAGGKAITLLQRVQILAVAQEAQDPLPAPADGATTGALGKTPDDAEAQPGASSVTVAVTPEQAQVLALASENAELYLTLRGRGENSDVQLGESTLSGLGIAP